MAPDENPTDYAGAHREGDDEPGRNESRGHGRSVVKRVVRRTPPFPTHDAGKCDGYRFYSEQDRKSINEKKADLRND